MKKKKPYSRKPKTKVQSHKPKPKTKVQSHKPKTKTKTKQEVHVKQQSKTRTPRQVHGNKNKGVRWIWLIAVLVATFVAFYPTFNNGFTNWDDNDYITENKVIKKLDAESLDFFFTEYYMGNYHPLTMLSYAIDYSLSETEPEIKPIVFQITTIAFHLLNTFLVFWFIFWLVRRIEANTNKANRSFALPIAVITSLFFGVATMHVESVTWMAERKDVLYTFFYFIALICYVFYLKKFQAKFYILTLLFFILSLLSKGQAVSLAITLFAVDYVVNRKIWTKKAILEKIPFLILALVFGIIAIKAQQASGAVQIQGHSFLHKIAFSSFGFVQYIVKLFVPYKLSALYPYPFVNNGQIPLMYWLHVIPALFIVALTIYLLYRGKQKPLARHIAFGILFFMINIFLVLQLLQVGGAVMADRYSYLPSVGLFFILGLAFRNISRKKKSLQYATAIGITIYALVMIYFTFERTKVWKNSLTLWNDVLSKYTQAPEAWVNRGNYKYNDNDLEGALFDYNKAIELKPDIARALAGRGVVRRNLGDYKGAIEDYNKALKYRPDDADSYSNRGVSKASLGDLQGAMKDFQKAIELDSTNYMAYSNSGSALFKLERYKEAMKYYDKSIEIKPNYGDAYGNRGGARFQLGDLEGAMQDFNKALQLNPEYPLAYFNRAIIKQQKLKDYKGAIEDCTKAIKYKRRNGYPEAFYIRAQCKVELNQMQSACDDFQKALQLGVNQAARDIQKYCQ